MKSVLRNLLHVTIMNKMLTAFIFLGFLFSTAKRDVNVLLVVIVGVIVVVFISLPIITYSCIKCFELIDSH